MAEWLLALAKSGATTLVGAAATDVWQQARAGFARLFGRGDAQREALAASRLDALAVAVEQAGGPGTELDAVRQRQQAVWETRLGDLLEEDPEVAQALRRLCAELLPQLPAAQQQWLQHITASAPGASAQGVMFGNLINHPAPPSTASPAGPAPR